MCNPLSFEFKATDSDDEVSLDGSEIVGLDLWDSDDDSCVEEQSEAYRSTESDSMGKRNATEAAVPSLSAGARTTRRTAREVEEFIAGPSRSTRGTKMTKNKPSTSLKPAAPNVINNKKRTATTNTAIVPAGKRRKSQALETKGTPQVVKKQSGKTAKLSAAAAKTFEVPPVPIASADATTKPKTTTAPATVAASEVPLADSIFTSPSPPRRLASKQSDKQALPTAELETTGADKNNADAELMDVEQDRSSERLGASTPPPLTQMTPPRRFSPREQPMSARGPMSNLLQGPPLGTESKKASGGGTKKDGTSNGVGEAPWWDPLDAAKVRQAKAVFHYSSHPVQDIPLCRERQVASIETWLKTRLTSTSGGSLYVSGPPGTGKSLTVAALIKRCSQFVASPSSGSTPSLVAVNCMRLTDPRQVVLRILAGCRAAAKVKRNAASTPTSEATLIHAGEDCDVHISALAGSDPLELLKREVLRPSAPATATNKQPRRRRSGSLDDTKPSKSKRTNANDTDNDQDNSNSMLVVILDELDGLLGSGRMGDELLGDLFALAHSERSRLVLIGIANSIDLVQQLMRPGGALHRRSIQPNHEIFPSYLRMEVSRILNQRVQLLPDRVVESNAIEFCARKVANGNGDMRRALEACNQAIDILVADTHKTAEVKVASPKPRAITSPHKKPSTTVGMRHMAAALNRVTGGIGASNDNVTAIKSLPVPQQLMLCVLSDAASIKRNDPAKQAHKFMGAGSSIKRSTNGGSKKAAGPSTGHCGSDATLAELADTHASLCRRLGIQGFAVSELCTVADVLQDLGLVKLAGGGKGLSSSKIDRRQRKVGLAVPLDDVTMALAEVPVLKDVVGQGSVGRMLKGQSIRVK